MGKGEIARYEQFLLFPQCFQKAFSQGCQKAPLCGNGLKNHTIINQLRVELSYIPAYKFQENLIKTMMQIENTYMDLAATCKKNCLIICDRGLMDGSACKYKFGRTVFSHEPFLR